MSLGETIYRLRAEKNLSQGDLAERLEVSRQSVSKWENDSAVPDLAKIVKLSEVFEVSLDELVKGEKAPQEREELQSPKTQQTAEMLKRTEITTPKAEVKSEYNNFKDGLSGRKIAGIILFCMAFLVILFFAVLGGLISGLIYASPFWICGILCFVLKKNVGLWCAWAVYVLVDTCLAILMGFSRAVALHNFGLTFGSIFAWIMILALVVLIAVTVVRFGKKPFPVGKKGYLCLVAPWVVWIVLHVFSFLLGSTVTQWYDAERFVLVHMYRFVSILLSWGRIIALTVGLVMVVRFVRTIRKQRLNLSHEFEN